MNQSAGQSVLSWIEGTFPMGEALAIGGQLADGSAFNHGVTAEYAACMDAALWSAFRETLAELANQNCDANRSAWVFENAILWIATRADGGWIGVFTPRDISAEARTTLHQRLDQFVTLT